MSGGGSTARWLAAAAEEKEEGGAAGFEVVEAEETEVEAVEVVEAVEAEVVEAEAEACKRGGRGRCGGDHLDVRLVVPPFLVNHVLGRHLRPQKACDILISRAG